MEFEQHPSSSLLLHQHDFSSLVSWPHHWQPESFEIILNSRSISPGSKTLNIEMTQVVPEHVARAKIGTGASGTNPVRRETNSTHKSRPQRSNSATLSTISVTCDTDTSLRSRQSRMESSVSKKNLNPSKHIVASQSTSTLINTSHVHPPPSSLSIRSHKPIQTSASNTAIANSLIVTSGMNIIHEKSRLPSSTSTVSIPNRHLAKASAAGATGGGTHPPSSRTLSNTHKTASLDDPNRSTQTRGLGKSVLEHLVFVFPENVRKMLAGPKNLPSRTADIPQPTESNEPVEPPTNDELKGWAESFDKLMMSPCGRRYFRDFLRSEYSEENFLFWMSCEALKNEQNPERIEEKARLIYEDYISILSPKEVSLDSRVREVINKNMVEPSPHTFDEAQLQIYTLMHRDSYPRFINSQIYRRLLTPEGTRT